MLCGPPLNHCSLITPSPSLSPNHPPPGPIVPLKPENGSKRKLSIGAFIAIAIGGFAMMFLSVLVLVLCCVKKKDSVGSAVVKRKGGRIEQPKEDFGSGVQEAEKKKLVFFEGCLYNFDPED
ncbi:hypothetical protein CerSpe_228910 [Prunus speciosa]